MTNWYAEALPQIRDELGLGDIAKKARSAVHFKGRGREFTAVLQVQPIFYIDEAKDWQPIDTALRDDGNGWFGAPGLPFKIHPDGRGKVGSHEHKVSDLPATQGLVRGNQLVREFGWGREIWELRERRLKHSVFLDRIPPASFAARIQKAGRLPEGIIEHPIVCFDANGDVFLYLGNIGKFRAWLEQAAYPVEIDPTYSSQPDATAGLDTWINDLAATDQWGTQGNVDIGEQNSVARINRTLIKFDFSSIPAGAVSSSVTLSLWLFSNIAANARNLRFYRQKRGWVETEATWNIWKTGNSWSAAGGFHINDCEQTGIASLSQAAAESAGEKQWTNWTTTSIDAMFPGGGWPNNGLMGKADTEVDDMHRYRSSNYGTPAERPKMVIVYTTGAVFLPKTVMM